MFHKRKYTPINPHKYEGNPNNIIMRSSWETRFASWCDKSDHVLKWKSEETVVPYRSPIDDRIHRYFIDFTIQIKDKHENSEEDIAYDIQGYKNLKEELGK